MFTTVYVPPSANAMDAANMISSHIIDLETSALMHLKLLLVILITVHLKHQSATIFNK